MEKEGRTILEFVENLSRKIKEYMRTHGLPAPEIHVFVEGGSRVILETERSPKFPKVVRCIFTPPTYTVLVGRYVVTYDTLVSHDSFRIEDKILNTLFDVMLEYVIED